ncbi:alpha/beta fold hydrolase [Thiothrix nivea]|uniref:Alpha/beta hydrolase fold containing protein n=1 Tax=Thiothrix nivea (strain ATCC 35100 / DSM 5205 / JP2) TaxID=870187 RepID=A0A656HLD1_THINJ|nr:alpha/beta hydrolase [Thiothrix nivea]EIJ36924.1 alpha/beta hydrolase fold containing protein [Thiothrix nivea DSM 5205]
MIWRGLLGGLAIALIAADAWLWPVPANFLHYLGWRLTSSVAVEAGNISLHGARIHYVAYGEGKSVLLLHGGLSNRLSWFSQVPWLVESGRKVVLVDTRGHGESTLGHGELNYHQFAKDAIEVLDRLHIPQTDIIGWSDGGITALLLGRDWPQQVGKIVAISANFDPSGLTAEANTDLQAEDAQPAGGVWQWLKGWWSGAGEHYPTLASKIRHLWRTEPRLSRADLQAIRAPVLVMVGERDVITLEHSTQLANGLADGRLVVVAGAGHAAPVTHADEVDWLVAAFLGIDSQGEGS